MVRMAIPASAGCTVGQGPRSHAALNAALASSNVSATPPFGPYDGERAIPSQQRLLSGEAHMLR